MTTMKPGAFAFAVLGSVHTVTDPPITFPQDDPAISGAADDAMALCLLTDEYVAPCDQLIMDDDDLDEYILHEATADGIEIYAVAS